MSCNCLLQAHGQEEFNNFDNDLENIFQNTPTNTSASPATTICKPDKWNSFKTKLVQDIDNILKLDCNRNLPSAARNIIDEAFEKIQRLFDSNDNFITATESALTNTTTTTPRTTTKTTEKTTTTTSTTAAPTTTTTTVKPIIYCGWNNESRCIKRWNCKNQPKKEEKFQINLRENGVCHYLETCCSTENIVSKVASKLIFPIR